MSFIRPIVSSPGFSPHRNFSSWFPDRIRKVQEEVAWSIGVLASDPESETLLAELGAVRASPAFSWGEKEVKPRFWERV